MDGVGGGIQVGFGGLVVVHDGDGNLRFVEEYIVCLLRLAALDGLPADDYPTFGE